MKLKRRDRKEQRREEAKERQEKFNALTLDEKIESAGAKQKKKLIKLT